MALIKCAEAGEGQWHCKATLSVLWKVEVSGKSCKLFSALPSNHVRRRWMNYSLMQSFGRCWRKSSWRAFPKALRIRRCSGVVSLDSWAENQRLFTKQIQNCWTSPLVTCRMGQHRLKQVQRAYKSGRSGRCSRQVCCTSGEPQQVKCRAGQGEMWQSTARAIAPSCR